MEANYEKKGNELIERVRIDLVTHQGEPIKGAYRETITVYPGKEAAKAQLAALEHDLEGIKHAIKDAEKQKGGLIDKNFVDKVKRALQAIEYEAKFEAKVKQNKEIKAEIERRVAQVKKVWPDL